MTSEVDIRNPCDSLIDTDDKLTFTMKKPS
jgi:hypothetical protein